METERQSMQQLSRKEVMVVETLCGCRRDGKRCVSFGGSTVLSSYNIALKYRESISAQMISSFMV